MRQRFFNPKTGGEVGEPMGAERGMRGFPDKAPVAKKPVMKPGSRPLAHHPHDIVGARAKPHMPPKSMGEQPTQAPDVSTKFDGEESPAHEAKESKAFEKKEHAKHHDAMLPTVSPAVGPLTAALSGVSGKPAPKPLGPPIGKPAPGLLGPPVQQKAPPRPPPGMLGPPVAQPGPDLTPAPVSRRHRGGRGR